MAIAQNVGTMITALLPALFAAVAPPGSANIPLTVGSLALGICAIAALAAWFSRESSRIELKDLGTAGAVPLTAATYAERRQASITAAQSL